MAGMTKARLTTYGVMALSVIAYALQQTGVASEAYNAFCKPTVSLPAVITLPAVTVEGDAGP